MDRMDGETDVEARLRALLLANAQVVGELDLDAVLRRVVEMSIDLVGADFGALGVVGSGPGLERFIQVGMSAQQAQAIGHEPHGVGLLGALMADPEPIRIDEIGADPRSVGFPARHPSMREFLGVPIRSRDRIFGNLYLGGRPGGFTASDEEVLLGLAATAGLAIENARLFGEIATRQRWAAASAQLSGELLQTEPFGQLPLVAERLSVLAPRSEVELQLAGAEDPGFADVDVAMVIDGRTLVLPIEDGAERIGLIVLRRSHAGRPYSASELEMAGNFARQASVAVSLARARRAQQQYAVVADRQRIARELHDHVIQQLFGAGLAIQGIAGDEADRELQNRVGQIAGELDDAIGQIRLAIFAISPQKAGSPSLRHRVIDLVEEYRGAWPRAPHLDFRGPLDSSVTGRLADDVLTAVHDAVGASARRARARGVAITVWVDDESVGAEVVDDEPGHEGSRTMWSAPLGGGGARDLVDRA